MSILSGTITLEESSHQRNPGDRKWRQANEDRDHQPPVSMAIALGARFIQSSGDVERLIEIASAQMWRGIILDLRSNGGDCWTTIKVTACHIAGISGQTQDRRGNLRSTGITTRIFPGAGRWRAHITNSASASEIVAGRHSYYKRAVVIGNLQPWERHRSEDLSTPNLGIRLLPDPRGDSAQAQDAATHRKPASCPTPER